MEITTSLNAVQFIVRSGLLSKEEALLQQRNAARSGQKLLHFLVLQGLINAKILSQKLLDFADLPFYDLNYLNFEKLALTLIDSSLIKKYRVLPLQQENDCLHLLLGDPFDKHAQQIIGQHTNLFVKPVLVEIDKLEYLIAQNESFFQKNSTNKCSLPQENFARSISSFTEEQPIVSLVDNLLLKAIALRASDIHFEPLHEKYRVRFRLDGILHEEVHFLNKLVAPITARLKIMAGLDIAERRIPQDGHFNFNCTSKEVVDFRVSTCPTIHGEKTVLRLLTNKTQFPSLTELGFLPEQECLFRQAISKPQGMILVGGPTGSGKSLSLYAALALINTVEKNILTIEDPVEIFLPGINQVNINPKGGLKFDTALRSFMRQDPDVIMVGEIRDFATADIATKAANTGHLILASIHANSAWDILSRLINLGISAFTIANNVSLLVGQRLVRKLCSLCKIHIAPDEYEHFKIPMPLTTLNSNPNIYRAGSCPHCHQGYQGRVGVFEILPMSQEIAEILAGQMPIPKIVARSQQKKITSLYQSALQQLYAGVTSMAEIQRVIPHE